MRSSKKLKVCKVESIGFAKYCVQRGVNFIGVHIIDFALDKSKQELCRFIAAKNGKAVLVTKERSLDQLKNLVAFYHPWAIQLHYEITAKEYRDIKKALQLEIVPVFTDETDESVVTELLEACDTAIYDSSFVGGTSKQHARRHLNQLPGQLAAKVLLAGGITSKNIADDDRVGGYDVQSYLRVDGRHHYGRAEKLFDIVKGAPKRQLSISLTDVESYDDVLPYTEIESLEYQVDYSVGHLYGHFKVDSTRLGKHLKEIDAPFTFHIFETDPKVFQQVIDRFMDIAGDKIVRINIQYSPWLDLDSINTYDAKFCASIYYKDLEDYLERYPKAHPCTSLILASEMPRKKEYMNDNKALIERLNDTEVWFDRKVDLETIELVLNVCKDANFIAGEYILGDWGCEAKAMETLNG